MKNITLITSIIDTPNLPLSYTACRSVYSKSERFEQTKRTISSVKEKIPNNKIFLVECSPLTEEETDYFIQNTDIFINIYDKPENMNLITKIHSSSKASGEATFTIFAIEYLLNEKIEFDNFFKISGRYLINDDFNYDLFHNHYSCIKKTIHNFYSTVLYKFNQVDTFCYMNYLKNLFESLEYEMYEIIFTKFINDTPNILMIDDRLGVSGYVSFDGNFSDI